MISDQERADWLRRADQATDNGERIMFGVYCNTIRPSGRRCSEGSSCTACSLLALDRIKLHYGSREVNPQHVTREHRKEVLG